MLYAHGMSRVSPQKILAPLDHYLEPSAQHIEISAQFQIPSFQIIGLPSRETLEAKDRVSSAIRSSGIEFPKKKLIVNLSPSSVKKHGTGADLAIAAAVLNVIQENFARDFGQRLMFWGELGLDGWVKPLGRPYRSVYAAWVKKADALIVAQSQLEACAQALKEIQNAEIFKQPAPRILGVQSLKDLFKLKLNEPGSIGAGESLSSAPLLIEDSEALLPLPSFLARVLTISAAGTHHLLLLGPKGQGKTHATHWMEYLLPPPLPGEQIQRILLAELLGTDTVHPYVRRISVDCRPASLLGHCSDSMFRPGEFALAHGGMLIADEFPEWHRDSRELLREPLESRMCTVTRAKGNFRVPAGFQFIATGNLCPCGGDWLEKATCRCLPHQRDRYFNRLSGPILDRIDAVALITRSPDQKEKSQEPHQLQAQVEKTRSVLKKIWGKPSGLLRGHEIEKILRSSPPLSAALDRLTGLNPRSRHKVVRLALTIAALNDRKIPSEEDLFEASLLRSDRITEKQA